MGLKDYRRYRKAKEIMDFLKEEYGIDGQMLRELPQALADLKSIKESAARPAERPMPSAEQTKDFKNKKEHAAKPEDIVAMFKDDVEEFYPNGKQPD
jgi:hypothetical protein